MKNTKATKDIELLLNCFRGFCVFYKCYDFLE